MRTQLSQYCQHFDGTVRPLLAPLEATISAMGKAAPKTPGVALRGELTELHHQVETLVDKVAGQKAYVLIFGPLKSGKSTLMNAIASAYVSEVSSLPAYPCLVFVSHGSKREFVVSDYRGRIEKFATADAVAERVRAAHLELAASIRQTEDAGEQFDPKEHFPAAIRRVDVFVPAPALAETGAVLVDTPGLYTRMRFGYDRMTRDFRNAAACAIFVVKSDTLFLEQVFSEFNQLLELFSRIFLVINIDSQKRDVGPDGKLRPSLEQTAPESILEAFESLAMTAPLKQAAEEGRVRMYPVDLMHAASSVLQKGGEKPPDGFVAFRKELTQYLASADYLAAFLRDSLQRAHSLTREVEILGRTEDVEQLTTEVATLGERRAECQRELDRIASCLSRDWKPAFTRFSEELEEEVRRRSRDHGARLFRAMGAAIGTWFLSGHSLQWLLDGEWKPLVRDYRETVVQAAQRCFEQSCAQPDGGLDLDPELAEFFDLVDVDASSARQSALQTLDDLRFGELVPLRCEDIPLKRGILDRLAMRSTETVRERLFGNPDEPDARIHAKLKASRLGEPAKHYMHQRLMQFRNQLLDETEAAILERFRHELQRATVDHLRQALRDREPGLRQSMTQIDAAEKRVRQVLDPLEKLVTAASKVSAKLHALSTQYAKVDPEILLQPAAPREKEPQAEDTELSRRERRRRDRSRG